MTSTAERVTKGAQFLDERDPDWWREDVPNAIDLDELELDRTDACVLGQRCPLEVLAAWNPSGEMWNAERYMAYATHLSGLSGDWRIRWACEHGFTLGGPLGAEREEWDALTDIWRVLILERRKLAADAGGQS